MRTIFVVLSALLLLVASAAQAQYTYGTNADGASIAIVGYDGTNGAVNIPAKINNLPVTSIEKEAFAYCSSLTNVTIPNSVTYLGGQAFQYCSNLSSVTIGNNVTIIGGYAFDNCTSLGSVTIPNSVIYIGIAAFEHCSSLTAR